jgi:hypothetical protein
LHARGRGQENVVSGGEGMGWHGEHSRGGTNGPGADGPSARTGRRLTVGVEQPRNLRFAALDGLGASVPDALSLAGVGRLVIRSTTSGEVADIGIFAAWGTVPRRLVEPTTMG